MMKFVNMFVIGMSQLFALSSGQIMDGGTALIGSSHDAHGCVTDGGYQWCDSLNRCVRPWMTPCPTIAVEPPLIDPGFGVPVNPPVAVDPLPPTPAPSVTPPPAPPAPPVPSNNQIPHNCVMWYDGCNHCQVVDGKMAACTRMMCFTQRPSECLAYRRLNLGDVCYRFCENGSEKPVNSRDKCPSGTSCMAPGTIGFDSCGSNAWTCQTSH